MTTSARHSKETNRWGTPENIVELSRELLGGIDLDPCSEAQFQETVRATRYYSLTERGEDGLLLPWHGRVLVNPPGGLVPEFWNKLCEELRLGNIQAAVWVGFSIEQLCLLADQTVHPLDFSACLLRTRLKFRHHADPEKARPSHANYVCALGVSHTKFNEAFGEIGRVSAGDLAV